ncbi:hypothetical protein DPMN_166535 [Dreissena polymorpha]|uniref:Uncharacterized protein n=1 Tax=Dreissena polymorpha TaxID=45954 RepID=A0A9D4EX80_DREPO|nr:hypothetical protein DPMN_166535 [Dreissena polymorpha]
MRKTYRQRSPKRQTNIPEDIKDLRGAILKYQNKNFQFLAEIPSCKRVIWSKDNYTDSTVMCVSKKDATETNSDTDTVNSEENVLVKEDVLSCFHNIKTY